MCLLIHRSAQKQNEYCVQFALLLTSHVASCPAKTKPRAKNVLLYQLLELAIDGGFPLVTGLSPNNLTYC